MALTDDEVFILEKVCEKSHGSGIGIFKEVEDNMYNVAVGLQKKGYLCHVEKLGGRRSPRISAALTSVGLNYLERSQGVRDGC